MIRIRPADQAPDCWDMEAFLTGCSHQQPPPKCNPHHPYTVKPRNFYKFPSLKFPKIDIPRSEEVKVFRAAMPKIGEWIKDVFHNHIIPQLEEKKKNGSL